MNRRSELSVHEVAANSAPWRPHVETSPGGSGSSLLLVGPSGGTPSRERLDLLRRDALEALHSYVVAATAYDHSRSMPIFRRVVTTLDNQLAPCGRAEQGDRR